MKPYRRWICSLKPNDNLSGSHGDIMQPKVAIHGSCVSRDLAEFHGYEVTHYQARSSMCSKIGGKIDYDSMLLNSIKTNFQRRMVEWDLGKRPFTSLNSDFVLIDLIDERFDVFTNGESFATRSQAFFNSSVLKSMGAGYNRIERGSEQHLEFFRHGVRKFTTFLDKPVFFHDARWAEMYRVNQENFNFKNSGKIRDENALLGSLSEIIQEEISFTKILRAPSLTVGDASHKWGPASFHYIPEYYQEINKQILQSLD